jgi:iron complex transport system ATP-binding protein
VNPLFELDQLTCDRPAAGRVLTGVTARLTRGEFVALCGLNGAGKSTLLEIMAGLLRTYSGGCRCEGREVRDWPARQLAQRISFLPQSAVSAARFTGAEVVRMGRYPFVRGWDVTEADLEICRQAMRQAGCEELSGRFVNELSGGERQRVLFAAVLAQQPRALLLDEPGTFVDLPHQIQMFRTLRALCAQGTLCIAATHDLNLAAAFCSRIILLDRGRVAADAAPAEVLASDGFRNVFGEHVRVEQGRVHYEI